MGKMLRIFYGGVKRHASAHRVAEDGACTNPFVKQDVNDGRCRLVKIKIETDVPALTMTGQVDGQKIEGCAESFNNALPVGAASQKTVQQNNRHFAAFATAFKM